MIVHFQEPQRPSRNVPGWERGLSIAAGLAMAGRGLLGGGWLGLAQLGLGGALLARGVTGHCTVKGLVQTPEAELRRLSADLRRLADALERRGYRHYRPSAVTVEVASALADTAAEGF